MSIDFNDALTKLKSISTETTYTVELPRPDKNDKVVLTFRKLQLSQSQEIAKQSLGTSREVADVCSEILKRNEVKEDESDDGLDALSLNKMEHLLLTTMLKCSNDLSLTLECESCLKPIKHIVDFKALQLKYNEKFVEQLALASYDVKTEITDGQSVNFTVGLTMPSIGADKEFNKIKDKRVKTTAATINDENPNKSNMVDNLDYYITEYEGNYLYVDSLAIDGEEVENFNQVPMSQRVKLLGQCPTNIIQVDKIVEFDNKIVSSFELEVECPNVNCKHTNNHEITLNDLVL